MYQRLIKQPLYAIILINVMVTIVLYCSAMIHNISGTATGTSGFTPAIMLSLPAGFEAWLHRPWSIVSYMFTQVDLLQLICNMLWLWMFGRMFSLCIGARKDSLLWVLYLAGGVCGGICFMLCGIATGHTHTVLVGASAATLAVICVPAMRLPDFRVNLLLFGSVKLKWIAVAAIVYFVLVSTTQSLASTAAHIGGVIAGVAFALWLRYRPKQTLYKAAPSKQKHKNTEAELDKLLKKVSKSGYSSLTAAEKKRLIQISKQQ